MSDEFHHWHSWLDDEKTILLTEYPAHFTWEEYREAGSDVWRMFSTVKHKVVHLSDYSRVSGRLPPGAFAQLRRVAMLIEHRNFEHFVLFGINGRMIATMGKLFEDVYGNLTIVDTKKDALAFIEKMRESKPNADQI